MVPLGFRSQRAERRAARRARKEEEEEEEEEEEAWEGEPEGGSIWRSWEKPWSKPWSGWSTHRFFSFRSWLLVFEGVWFGGNPKKNMKERGAWRRRRKTWKGEESVNKSTGILFLFWPFSSALLCVMVAFEFRLHDDDDDDDGSSTFCLGLNWNGNGEEMRSRKGTAKSAGFSSMTWDLKERKLWSTYLLTSGYVFVFLFLFLFLFFAFLFPKGSFF